ncbi:DUF4153 domain-containing protein [Streptosporangium sp. NBC_01756]|uniref:DUF4153 domain-containing protein n=1 Tax=Streptosporangium sp. NBC_01756 TaxID=2975950 RepID=UPI002DD9E16A|nr:DUF4153 domain-containing protein [Streptosporangium sp. NBC_01756]WSC83979.1 DUF4173 domain-containing protein [Streptosporangium sp. NBC_01756]
MRPLDFLGRIKVKLGLVILLAVVAAFVVNEVGINAGYSRNVRVAVAVVLALIMVQLLARGMTKPLREMAAAAQTIAKGRYGLRVAATSRDEVGELARAFNAMAADLGEVDRQRRELVANVSHELRTPITALRAVLENMVDGVSAPDQATLETALAQAERLGRLVAQLLDLSRLESGARLIELEDVELGPLCDQALREAVLARDGVTARCEVAAELNVRADPDLLAQVLANLLDNAVRHSPDGGVVVLAAVAAGEGVRLRVTDEGPGIPAEDRARAFERFSRLDAGRAADDGGAGLGLAITKEIVELHGGSVHVEEGAGCRIAVDLPGRITMDDPDTPDPSTTPPVQEAPPFETPGSVPDLSGVVGHAGVPAPSASDAPDPEPRRADAVVPSAGKAATVEPVRSDTPETAHPDAAPTPARQAAAEPVPSGHAPAPVPGEVEAAPPVPHPVPAFPPVPVLRGSPAQPPVRNWGAAFLGVVVGGLIGLLGAVVPAFVLISVAPLLGMLAGVLILAAGAFVGTVIGATTPPASGGAWGRGDPLAHLPSAYSQRPAIRVRETVAAGGAVAGGAVAGGAAGEALRRPEGGGDVVGRRGVAVEEGDARHPAGPQEGGRPSREPGDAPRLQGNDGLPPGGYVAPPVFPRPELPVSPRWVVPVCAAAGLLAAFLLPDSAMGLGFVLVAVAMGSAVLPIVRRRITPWSVTLGVIAYGLVAVAVFRDADWLVGPLLLAGFLLAALAVSGAGRGWLAVARGGASVLLGLLPVPWFLAAQVRTGRVPLRRRMVPVLLGGGLTVVLVVVFGALFASADAVFANTVEQLFAGQDWAASVPLRVLLFVVFGALVASAALVGLRPVADPDTPGLRLRVSRGLWVTPLVALNLLFAVFVGMQLTVLFGDSRWVDSATGLTYAEYARSGFFQLVVVSVFVLAIVAVASGALRLTGRDRWLMAGLLGLLCALTLVILASALHRLDLYVEVYGFSRLRASVEAAIWWLGGVFVLVLIAGAVRLARRGGAGWFPRTLVAMTGVALLAFAVWNPDLRVAETQLTVRGVQQIDREYLGDLGAEAVPALDRLPEPSRSCVLRDVVLANDLRSPDAWNGWNLARQRARELLDRRPVLENITCVQEPSRLYLPSQDWGSQRTRPTLSD